MNNRSKLLFLLFLGFLTFSLFVHLEMDKVKAGSGDNVYDYAWSENIGWISFNNNSGGGSTDYGVNIDEATGLFSGYAWSENIGWISFNQADLSGCPSGVCEARVDLNSSNNLYGVSGWARALAGKASDDGWDGWIKLNGNNYGVVIDNSVSPAEFKGWAWSDAVIGWINFNCNNPESENHCSVSDYSVKTTMSFNSPPIVTPNNPQPLDYCHYSLPTQFSWVFSDPDPSDFQDYYKIQIDNNSDFSSPEVDSGKVDSSSEVFTPIYPFSYNDTYYWRVNVWDNNGADSGWVDGPSLNTPLHALPQPDFSWSPESPSIGELVQLFDESTCYDASNNPASCSGNTFFWTLPPEGEFVEGFGSTDENPQIKFNEAGSHNVSLKITDDLGACTKIKQITASPPLPEWEEEAPQ
jgi:hypothetical protein